MFNRKLLVAILAAGTLAGCENDSSRKQPATLPEAVNTAPSVVITSIDAVEPGAAVTVEAMATDAEGNISSYEWTQTAGSSVQLSGTDSDTLSFTAPAAETASKLTFTLTVTDEEGASDSAEVTVDVLANAAPTVEIEAVDPVATQTSVTLIATATDDFSEELSYVWEQLDPEQGYEVSIAEQDNEATFVTPATKFNKSLQFKVTASDEFDRSTAADTEVKVIGDIHAEIKAVTDAVVISDFATVSNGDDGYLYSDTATGNGVYEWTRNDSKGYKNITAPIARFLAEAGYLDAAKIGFEEMYARTNVDPTDPANFSSSDLGAFLAAYEATEEVKYLDIAQAMFEAVQSKYDVNNGGAREAYWGYDTYNLMYGAVQAYTFELDGADTYLQTMTEWYNAQFATYNADSYHALFTNRIYEEFGIGERIDSHEYTAEDLGYQATAYALMGKSIDKEEAVDYLLDHINDAGNVSLEVAEGIDALRNFADE